MEAVAKVFDGVVKAPLWVFFAACIACWLPLFNFDLFQRAGVTNELRLAGIPIGFWALCSTAVFLSSLAARLTGALGPGFGRALERTRFRLRLGGLTERAATLLSIAHGDAWHSFAYDPDALEIVELREKEILRADAVHRSGGHKADRLKGGEFEFTSNFRNLIAKHPSALRSLKPGTNELHDEVRKKHSEAAGYLMWLEGQ